MKILLKILVGLASVFALLLVVALFVRNEYEVKREITISKPTPEVFDYIKYQKNMDHYNKWVMVDPNMKKEYTGTDGTVGFIYAWDSATDAGKGELEIKNIDPDKTINLEIRFVRPFESVGLTEMSTLPVSDHETLLKWGMSGRSPYPMNIMNLFIDGMLGKDLEESLNTLKGIVENK
ncbi:SRPBCC family protein [Dyadobacter bucti]|uniref:SRPBCC family protein n=1 Tax=Dyadobacter bucti TaxID=2572203 RepID=UPI0011082E81|nr:SRPBCC family protein [Dyadobacter bucti]